MPPESNTLVLTDIRIRFWRLVVLMITVAIASIPAGIILWVLSMLVSSVLGGMLYGLMR